MKIPTFIIDAFTEKAFAGNPAGVCILEQGIETSLQQSIATELNHSETAFLQQDPKNPNLFNIRYFTRATEIDFCGHATLASAKLIFKRFGLSHIDFITAHGLSLSAKREGERIIMKFPLFDAKPFDVKPALFEGLGIKKATSVGYAKELSMLLIEIESVDELKSLTPDYAMMKSSSDTIKEVVVTAKSNDGVYDFYSRCFCPWIGIDEDPVTGAAHSVLGKYWAAKLGKTQMKAFQCSERGGFMDLRILDDTTLEVSSYAQIILEGEINL